MCGAEVEDPKDSCGEDDPEKLVPVEEGESPERGCGAGIELWEAEAEVRQKKQKLPRAESPGLGGRRHR